MNRRLVLSKIQSFPEKDVRRAKATVLRNELPPENPRELDHVYWLVWLILAGALIPQG